MAFICKEANFLRTFQVSESLIMLLRRIWHPVPMKRMSIPAIRQAITEMDTFYKPLHSSHVASPLSNELVLIDSSVFHTVSGIMTDIACREQTCIAPVGDEKEEEKDPIDALDEAFRRLELMLYEGY